MKSIQIIFNIDIRMKTLSVYEIMQGQCFYVQGRIRRLKKVENICIICQTML